MNNENIYTQKPFLVKDGIPYFSKPNNYIENYEKIAHDHIAAFSQEVVNPFITEDLWFDIENSTRSLLRKYLKENDSVLDVGVGMGRLLSPLGNIEKFGMDISIEYLKISRDKGISVCYAMIEDMPYQRELFDVIVCTDVLEHVIDLNLCFKNILGVLKKDGLLIFRVPYKENLSHYLTSDYPYEFVHLRNYDEYSLRLFCEKIYNLDILEITKAGYIVLKHYYRFDLMKISLLSFLFKIIMKAIKTVSTKYYSNILKLLTNPVEINMVVRKK
jgi:SAM-dependent methyltransferase